MKNQDFIFKALKSKDSLNRFKDFTKLLEEVLNSSEVLFKRNTFDEDCEELYYLIKHCEVLWDESLILFNNECYSSAIFFSIVAIEELGKCSIGRFLIFHNEFGREKYSNYNKEKVKKDLLRNHRKKHQIAAFSGLAINSRADRILGSNNILKLFNLIKGGHLENIRQKAIYSESENGLITLPKMKFSKEDAIFFCSTAGELLCEIGGVISDEFFRLEKKVSLFESINKLEKYELNIK